MFKRFLSILLASLLLWHVAGAQSRAEWVDEMTRIAGPVLENLAQGNLKANMPFESLSKDPLRKEVSYLETDPFWSRPDADWTSRKAWNGIDVGADHAR